MVQTRRKRKQKKSRKLKRQRGGNGVVATILLATKKEIDDLNKIEAAFSKTFGKVTAKEVSEDDEVPYMTFGNANIKTTIQSLLIEDAWGFPRVRKEKNFFYTFTIEEPPAYLSKTSCSADSRLTRLEGEIGLTFISEKLPYQLIPRPHGLTDESKYFFVGIHEGDSSTHEATLKSYANSCS